MATTTTTTTKPALDLSNPSPAVLKPQSLAHIFLQTTAANFLAMVAFYKTFLSATASFESERAAFLTYDDEHHRIAIGAMPGVVEGEKGRKVPGMRHVAFTYGSLVDLATAYRQRKMRHGLEPYWCINHGITTSMYYRDPDGNGIEVQVDNFDTPEEATGYMKSNFEKNPLGAEFDPEELVRRLERGESEAEIKRVADVGTRDLVGVIEKP